MSDQWCKHYNGLNNDNCNAGVRYDEIRPVSRDLDSYCCLNPHAEMQCLSHELRTQEEIEARNKFVADFIENLNTFWTRETEDCPQCGKHVTSCEQIGRCIYARPCGCRVSQGRLHPNWA